LSYRLNPSADERYMHHSSNASHLRVCGRP